MAVPDEPRSRAVPEAMVKVPEALPVIWLPPSLRVPLVKARLFPTVVAALKVQTPPEPLRVRL